MIRHDAICMDGKIPCGSLGTQDVEQPFAAGRIKECPSAFVAADGYEMKLLTSIV